MKPVYKYSVLFAALLAAYLLFGVGAWLLPDAPVRHHVEKTLAEGDLDSDQPRAFLPRQQCRMDNFTDALILNQTLTMTSESLLDGVLLMPRKSCGLLPFEDLRALADGHQEMTTIHYGRYWHGNTFLLRYLLVLYDYISIRLLLYIVTTLLALWCAVLLWRKCGWTTAAAIMFGLAASYAFMMQFSIQFAPVLILALVGMIALARQKKPSLLPFFVIGSLTCYFDLLTAPMLTLGLMLLVQAAMMQEGTLWQGWWRTLHSALLWAAGYMATWVTKWLIATFLTSENVLADGLRETGNRSGVLDDYGRWDAVRANLDLLPWQFIVIVVLLLVLLAAFRFHAQGWRRSLQLLPIALLPWAWYFFTANHSYMHSWFTFRAQAVSIAAILLALMQLIDWKKIKRSAFGLKIHQNPIQKSTTNDRFLI